MCDDSTSMFEEWHVTTQELGQPLLTLEAGIAAGSYFSDGSSASGIMSVRRETGNAAAALASAKNTIKGAR